MAGASWNSGCRPSIRRTLAGRGPRAAADAALAAALGELQLAGLAVAYIVATLNALA